MSNLTNNKSKISTPIELEYLQIKNDFYTSLSQELLIHLLKIIDNYQKIIAEMKTSSSLNRDLKSLSKDIIGLYHTDLNSRKHSIKLIRNKIKIFNKNYNKKLYLYKNQ